MTSARTPGEDRIAGEDGWARHVEPDWTTSPEALAVLAEHGVDAWRRWCDEHQPAR